MNEHALNANVGTAPHRPAGQGIKQADCARSWDVARLLET